MMFRIGPQSSLVIQVETVGLNILRTENSFTQTSALSHTIQYTPKACQRAGFEGEHTSCK